MLMKVCPTVHFLCFTLTMKARELSIFLTMPEDSLDVVMGVLQGSWSLLLNSVGSCLEQPMSKRKLTVLLLYSWIDPESILGL